MLQRRHVRSKTLCVLDYSVWVCVWLLGGQIKAVSCQITLPLSMTLPPSSGPHHTPSTQIPHPPTEEGAAVWPGFYLLLSVRCCAPVSLAAHCMMGRCGRWSNPRGSQLSATAAVRCSPAASASVWQPPWRKRVREAQGREGKGEKCHWDELFFPHTKACLPAMCCRSPGCQISGD